MKNAPDITTTRAPESTDSAPSAPAIRRTVTRPPVNKPKAGDSYTRPVMGREVTFKLQVVPAAEVAARTSVWKNNERLQEYLTEAALADILPSLRADGQDVPAYGRPTAGGGIEAADGSRRRMGCILAPCDYLIWVADLTDAEMDHFTRVGNEYCPPSAYERGKRYQRLLDEGTSLRQLEEDERISRKVISRCILTASLPPEIVRLFPRINDISARAGEQLAKARTDAMLEYARDLPAPQDPEAVVPKLLAAAVPPKAAPAPQWKPDHWSIGYQPGKGLQIEVGEEVPEKLRAKIARWVEKQLATEEA